MLREKFVADLWQRQCKTTFIADNGAMIHVIFPGRPAYGGGCDFRDSVFLKNGIISTGNVEVHSRLRDWYAHGHDKDPKYKGVVLHVVMQNDVIPARLLDGSIVPTISLEYLDSTTASRLPVCDYSCRYAGEGILRILYESGCRRFLEKAERLKNECASGNSAAILLENTAAALGYSRNQAQFRKLVSLMPAPVMLLPLREMMAILFGLAGLLPSQRHISRNDNYTVQSEAVWKLSGYSQILRADEWCFSAVRPNNSPLRRIAALSHLLHRFRDRGLLKGLCDLIDAVRDNRCRLLEKHLAVNNDEYWSYHSDFGRGARIKTALLGGQRICDMLLSVYLPFLYGLSDSMSEKAFHIYSSYHRRGENEITRYMRGQLAISLKLTACHQQGLIDLFRKYCRTRDCSHCPVYVRQG